MKTTIKLFEILLVILLMISCKTEEISLKTLDGIQETKYYSTDIIPEQHNTLYGGWKVAGTSGGIAGVGYKKDFDYLIFKKNGIFGIVRNDSLLAYGKLTLLPVLDNVIHNAVFCRFDFENPVNIELYNDPEKYIQITNSDSLDLNAPCCDRYNTHFIRIK